MDPQDQTFMTIHNLTPDANILFASESIFDILGYRPEEVVNQSCFDYFHPDEVPLARSVHSRGVRLDKAAVLHYARILSKDGRWVSCECCFTVVHDVLVASTSIYNGGAKSEGRALTAPRVRRLFSSSPRDPRYHMLEHLSPKFKMPPTEREPRAALVLNRFTRNLTIMFATNAVTTILGLQPSELLERPFYHCIQENCLADAIACLESAKKNESIAYLRFRFRDPRQDDQGLVIEHDERRDEDEDEDDSDNDSTESDDTGRSDTSSVIGKTRGVENDMEIDDPPITATRDCHAPRAGNPPGVSCQDNLTTLRSSDPTSHHRGRDESSFELEAVVSCTSDGLVVVLRRARPPIPDPQLPLVPAFSYENGLFAAPWGMQPIEPYYPPELLYTFRAPFLPQYMPLQEHVKRAGGPPRDQLMRSIQDVAVFAWAVVGINGNLATYGHGLPRGGAQPCDGLPVWDPSVGPTSYQGPENRAILRDSRLDATSRTNFGYRARFGLDHAPTERQSPLSLPDDTAHGGRSHPENSRSQLCSLAHGNEQLYRHMASPRCMVEQSRQGYVGPRGGRCNCSARPHTEQSGPVNHRGCGDAPTFQSPPAEDSHYHVPSRRQ